MKVTNRSVVYYIEVKWKDTVMNVIMDMLNS